VAAIYPEPALRARQTGYVELLVTVLEDGRVSDVTVAQSAGAAFDAAAIDAVRAWRFSPAQRSGAAVASRIRVPFEFVPPALLPAPFPPAEATPASPSAPPSPPAPDTEHDHDDAVDVTVHGQRQLRTETRSVSDFRIERDVLAAAPRQEGIDVLKTAPGLYIGRGEGAALGHHYMLRGFDAEHGQDIEFRVGGLPINQRSHIHGQGYADLGFLIGESVSELRVSEGVYDPRQGDFAVAGSINVDLGVEEERRGVTLKSSYGAFDTTRHLALWAPRGAAEETLGAVQLTRSAGFGENRAGSAGSGVFQQRFGEGDHSYRAVGIAHAARSDMAGVLRQADVDSGAVCFGCVYDLPTARAQNAATSRLMVGLFADTTSNAQGNGQLGVWLGADDFRVQQNFTGFVERSSTLPGVAGRGDLIEQQNRTLSAGVTGRYRTSRFRPAAWAHGTVEVGADARLDDIEQAQRLIEAGRNETWDERVDASVLGVDLGVWGDLDWVIAKQIHLRAGLRADVLSYQINDRLGNFVELSRPQDSFIVGFRRSALGLAWGPRTSLEVHLSEALSLLTAYGEGYRSPQARQLEDGEPAPFTKVRSGDLGAHLDLDDALHLALGGYATRLSDDAAFDAGTDRLERTGATQRLGGVAQVVARPAPWLVGAASVTFVRATLLEPSPATTEEPQPAFQAGQALPFVPPLVVRADVGARHILFDNAGGRALGGRAGVGWSFLSPRPLPYAQSANAVNLLDTSIGLSWASAELTFELFNALDAEYAAVEYNFASDWAPDDDVRPRTPARHIAAGGPRTWLVSLGVTL
jgi:TonB family protein